MAARLAGLLLILVGALPATAIDLPVAGQKLVLRGSATRTARRTGLVTLRGAGIAAPFPDPRAVGATLVVHGGAADGQCFASVSLDAAGWTPIGADGPRRGYRYARRTSGVRSVVLRPGGIVVKAGGSAWPCAVAAAQRVPVTVALRIDTTRYCAAFGGAVSRNRRGRFLARGAPPPAACAKSDLTVADLNVLHGAFCPVPTDHCRLPERVALLFQWIAASGCPDVATLQEVSDAVAALIPQHLATTCPFTYRQVYHRSNGIDDEVILTRWEVGASELRPLLRNFRSVLFARIDHPMGPVDVFSTHLASGSDGAENPCGADCPAECVSAGAATVRACQGVQYAAYVVARHDQPTPAVATGDYNESPGSLVYDQFTARHGWTDTYLAAANPECDPVSGVGCTSGRADEELTQLEAPASNQVERIDYVFLIPPVAATCVLDPASDPDGDGSATRIFADVPNPFAPSCGPAPAALCWPSDHEGAEMDLNCS